MDQLAGLVHHEHMLRTQPTSHDPLRVPIPPLDPDSERTSLRMRSWGMGPAERS